MAGETLVRACFGTGDLCRVCHERVNARKGMRLAHAARHLQRLMYAGFAGDSGIRRGGRRAPDATTPPAKRQHLAPPSTDGPDAQPYPRPIVRPPHPGAE